MAYDTILFDIDGTLCDPGISIIESARYALAEMGIEETDEEALRRFVGPPLEHTFSDCYDFDEEKTAMAVSLFRDKLRKDGIKLYKTYDGIPELLEALQAEGKNLAIVTSKIDHIAKEVLESTGLLKYFSIIGAQQANEVVHKETILSRVLEQLNIDNPSSVLMVGDRMHDIKAATTHEVDSVGVLWGYGSTEEFKKEGATYIVESVSELHTIINSNSKDIEHHYAGVLLVTETGKIIGQQRDDKPGIDNPGKIGTFGGTVETGEQYRYAAWRELVMEETNLKISEDDLKLFLEDTAWRKLTKRREVRHFYFAQINSADLDNLEVYEGQGWAEIQGSDDPQLIEEWRPVIQKFINLQTTQS